MQNAEFGWFRILLVFCYLDASLRHAGRPKTAPVDVTSSEREDSTLPKNFTPLSRLRSISHRLMNLLPRNFTLAGLPIYVARFPAAPFPLAPLNRPHDTHLLPSQTMP